MFSDLVDVDFARTSCSAKEHLLVEHELKEATILESWLSWDVCSLAADVDFCRDQSSSFWTTDVDLCQD